MSRKTKTTAVISLILVFVFMFVAAGFNNDWGRVHISDVYYPNSEGGIIHAQLFIPENASSANPLPAILNMHGGSDYLQTVSNYSLELARRGYVVLSVDAYGSGASDYIDGKAAVNAGVGQESTSALKMDGGASLGIEQLLSYKFVDKENIGLTGHSMGGTYIANAALEYADSVKAIMPWGSGSFVDKMKSTDSSEFRFNVGYINAQCDEMVYFATGEETSKLLDDASLKNFFGTDARIVPEQVYGSFDAGTARVIYTPKATHIGNIICKGSVGAMASFFEMAMPTDSGISSDNQVWMYKEAFSVLAIAALVAFMISFAFVLLDSPVFAALKHSGGKAIAGGSSVPRLIGTLICIAVPALTLHKVGLWLATKKSTKLLPMNWANNLMWLAVINALIMLVVFLVWHFVWGKKEGSCLAAYGFAEDDGKVRASGILKAFLFAVTVIATIYFIVNLCYGLFKIDFRFWQFGIMPITLKRFAYFIPYGVFFLVAFGIMNTVSTAFASIGEKGNKGSTAKQYLLGWLIGAGGYTVIMLIYYIGLRTTFRPPFFFAYAPFSNGHPNSLVYSMKTTVLVPTFTIVSLVNTALYRKTKNVYVGWFVAAFMAAMILICTNAFAV